MKEDKERPNNGRLTFVTLLKEDQKIRMRQIFKDLKNSTAWMMEMQGAQKASDSMEVKRQKEKKHRSCIRARQHGAEPRTSTSLRTEEHQPDSPP